MIGRIVSDRYEVMKYLGGGMSSVYLARDIILDREVVVKLIKVDHQNREKSKARFQREVESTIHLAHPNIVSVLDVDESEEYHLLVTEVVHGPTLKEYIRDNHPVPLEEAIRISEMTLRGIKHAHNAGIIHRDIKPQNILMNEAQQIKITDFGIAKALSDTKMTETNQVMGSVQYISPEQAKGQKTDERTDIYSFGIVLYELLTGTLPFDGETAVSVALKHISEPLPDILHHRQVPEDLAHIVYKCTNKDPYDRYRQVDEILHDLNDFKEGRALDKAPPGRDEQKTVETAAVIPDAHEAEDEEEGIPRKRRWRALLWTVPLFLVMAALLMAGFMLWQGSSTVVMPDMQEMTMEEAEPLLEENDLILGEITEEYNNTFEADRIVETSPKADNEVEKGSTVDFVVSMGEEPYVMEDFTGDQYNSVRSTIDAIGFSSVEIDEVYDDSEPGTVLSQSIEAGDEVDPAAEALRLEVSQGLETVEVLDYTGQPYETAESELTEQGFNVEVIQEAYSGEVESGHVISQDPSYGNFVPGSPIRMIVSLGEEPPDEKQFAKEITIPYESEADAEEEPTEEENGDEAEGEGSEEEDAAEAKTVEIYVDDKDNSMDEVFDTLEITEDTEYTLNLIIQEGGTASYRIEVEGETVREEEIPYE
ncbi:Stk1 family PASTA domain-containing Ser/Thr kinase [Salinicoccus luteus]|uniref:Stk1 family PASTA domain-containing Ser/Thr kinase n=1 Tax=Salinicoccus luteus TaxID=367840 RepID=UPI000AB69DFF|nr:Stk1 family PASTA domain-containing Ser/Thr kinase [Salinicoccus luteus]